MTRVLHVLRSMNRAGVETWLMHLLRRFDRREIAIDFLVQSARPGSYDDEIRALGARILPCPKPSQPWRYAYNFLRILRQHGPYDVVHSHNYFFSGVDLRLAHYAGVPHRIAHIHPYRDVEAGRPLRPAYRRLMRRWIHDYATCVLAPSHASLEAFGRFVDWNGTRHGVIRNCVDLAPYRLPIHKAATRLSFGLPPDLPVIVYVARFVPHKNHRFLAQVAERLRQRGMAAHFAVAGTDGPERLGFELECAGRTDFSIFVDLGDIVPLLRCADLFLFPSTEEGFGTVAIEAAAAGLPVIAADLPAVREACAPSHRPYMFHPSDHESAAGRVLAILKSPSLARQLSDDAKLWAQEFSIDVVVEQLRAIYRAGSRSAMEAEAAVR